MARDTVAVPTTEAARPPDTRGPTSPRAAGILAAGAASLGIVALGSGMIQAAYALGHGPITRICIEQGLEPQIEGADGVCHILQGLLSDQQTTVLILGIALGAAAVAAGFSSYRRMDSKRKRHHCLTGAFLGVHGITLAAFLLWFRSGTPGRFAFHFLNFERLDGYLGAFLTGAKNTIVLAAAGEAGGIVLGLALAVLALSSIRAVRAPARMYINFFRGTPLVWQLSTGYFLLLFGFGIRLSPFVVAMLIFALNTAAYAAEVFRAGIQSIERGQMEAARSLGMSYVQAMRYAIVPQAVRRVIPPLMNEFVILIKDTSLILALSLTASELDLYNLAREGYSDTFNSTFFVAAAVGYLAITLPLIGLVNAVERRLRSGLVTAFGAGL
jgi:His/Glu/Gln/Arg/opine family amino acid ABC transporter permease subunit